MANANGVIYVMYCLGRYKIGKAKIGSSRFGEYTKLQEDTIYLITCVVENYEELEKELHSKFAEYRTNGEWFDLPKEALNILISEINNKSIAPYDIKSGLKRVKKITKSNNDDINRTDVLLMLSLADNGASHESNGLTIEEIMMHIHNNGNERSRMTVYRRLNKLFNNGYIGKGVISNHADTFYLLNKGKEFLNIGNTEQRKRSGRDALMEMRNRISNLVEE